MKVTIQIKDNINTKVYENIEKVDKDENTFKMERKDGTIIGVMLNVMELYIVEPDNQGDEN